MSSLQKAFRKPLRSFSTALRFLTVFPGLKANGDEQDYFGASLYYFAPVGILLGGLASFCALGLEYIASPLVSSVILALLLSAMSGFLHLDGLADTADGFLSSRDRQRSLEIMKDSRIGVMGAVGICSILLLKTAAIFSLDQSLLRNALIVGATGGRSAMVMAMAYLPYARPEGGLGQLFYRQASRLSPVLVSATVMLALTVFLLPGELLVVVGTFFLVLILFSLWCYKKIGGFTGDTLGCLCELMETALLISIGCKI